MTDKNDEDEEYNEQDQDDDEYIQFEDLNQDEIQSDDLKFDKNLEQVEEYKEEVVDEKQFPSEAYNRVLVICRSGFYPSMTGLTSDSGFGC
ncbi:MAG: hypothetical protein EZS28_036285, partial [Streblomastix strix]